MTCYRLKAIASASAVFLGMINFVSVSPASAAESQQHLSAAVLAYVSDGPRSDTVLPTSDAWARRGANAFAAAPALSRPQGASARPGSVDSPSQLGGMAGRFGGLTVADSGKKAAAAGMGRLDAVANPPGAAEPYKITKIAAVSGQMPLVAPESIGRVSPVANTTPARPGGIGETSFGGSVPHVNEETAPGPYTMLFIGLSLAAFMAFRRMAQL
jgi:hypothetical protein